MTKTSGTTWIPLIALFTLGMSNAPLLPIWLPGATQRFGLSPAQPGLIASLELACLAGSSILWASRRHVSGRTGWLIVAILASVTANMLSFIAQQLSLLICARIIAGLSLGLILAEVTRRAATLPDAQRVFARQQLGLILFIAAFFATVPLAVGAYGPLTPFAYGAALGIVALISTVWLPGTREIQDNHASRTTSTGTVRSGNIAAMVLVAIALTYLTQNGVWAYIADAAKGSQTDLTALGQILAMGAFINLLAPIAAERFGSGRERRVPLAVGYAGLVASVLLVTLGLGRAHFLVGAIGLNLSLMFVTPFLLGILAELDSSGRTAAAGPAFFTIGGAFGPALGGVLIATGGMPRLGIVLAVIATTALLLASLAISRSRRSPAFQSKS